MDIHYSSFLVFSSIYILLLYITFNILNLTQKNWLYGCGKGWGGGK